MASKNYRALQEVDFNVIGWFSFVLVVVVAVTVLCYVHSLIFMRVLSFSLSRPPYL